jgi:acetyl esterase/lipase
MKVKETVLCSFLLVSMLSLPASPQAPAPQPTPSSGRDGRGVAAAARPTRARMKIERDLEYAWVGGRALHLDLYSIDPATEARPLIAWLHGGGWSAGDKFPSPAARLIADGYAVASIEYRLSGEAKWPSQVFDCKAAIRWLRANASKYNIDPAHVGVWGASSGGYLAALLGTSGDVKELEGDEGNLDQSSRVQATVDFSGPFDPVKMEAASKAKSDLAFSVLFGGPLSQNQDKSKAANLVAYASKDDGPFLVIHGTADALVPPQQSEMLVSALKAAGVTASLKFVPGADHSINKVCTPVIQEAVTAFFDKNLRDGKRERGDLDNIPVPSDAWSDPIAEEYPPTLYKTLATPSRGPNTEASYRVYLPPDYETSKTRRYPVIYYLHGANEHSRAGIVEMYVPRLDAAVRSGIMPPVIVIVVQGMSGYRDPMETMIVKDLIPHVDATYRTIAKREARAIEGHSMGGGGSLRIGFKYPDLFGSVAAFAAAVSIGNRPGAAPAEAAPATETPMTLLQKNVDKIRGRTNIRLIVGELDSMTKGPNEEFDKLLTKMNVAHSFTVSKGAPHSVEETMARLEINPFEYYAKVFANVK